MRMCHPPRLPSLTFFVAFHLLIVLLTKFSLLLLVLQLPWKTTKGHPQNLACAGLNIMAMLNRFLKKCAAKRRVCIDFRKFVLDKVHTFACLSCVGASRIEHCRGRCELHTDEGKENKKKTREVRKVDRK